MSAREECFAKARALWTEDETPAQARAHREFPHIRERVRQQLENRRWFLQNKDQIRFRELGRSVR